MARRKTKTEEIKVTCIGGGSRGWARGMIQDLALCPQLSGHISLYDIDYSAARRNAEWGKRVFEHVDACTSFTLSAHRKVGPALKGADFVLIAIQPGPITMMASDIDIPLRYGVLQAVGDTAGPGGVVRALRCVPIYADYAREIMATCPDAWVISFTNPMALCVATMYAVEPDIQAVGYCHEVMHTQRALARRVEKHFGVKSCDRREIRLEVAGANHFTLAQSADWRGRDLFPMLREEISEPGYFADRSEKARERKDNGRWFESDGLIAMDFLRRLGVLGASGDRHLAEFVPWYMHTEEALHRWGVVVTPSSFRLKSRPDDRRKEELEVPEEIKDSGQEYVDQMLGLLGLGDCATTTNIPNRGQLPDWPLGAVIESNVTFKRGRVVPDTLPPFSRAVTSLQRRIIDQHLLTLRAGLERNIDLAYEAILLDPLVMIRTDEAWDMLREMLQATKSLLPGWKLRA